MAYVRGSKGSTLIEVLIAVAVLSAAVASMGAIVIQSMRGWSSGASGDGATSHSTLAVQKLCNEIRDGRSASVSNGVLSVTFPMRVVDGSSGQVTYDMSANDPYVRSYYVSGGELKRSYRGVVTTIMKGISAASFGANGGNVTITLTGSEHIGTAAKTHPVTTRVSLRNFRS